MARRLAIVSCSVLACLGVVLLAAGAGANQPRHTVAGPRETLGAQLRSFERVIAARGGLLSRPAVPRSPLGAPLGRAPRAVSPTGTTCYASGGACSIVPCAVFAQAPTVTAVAVGPAVAPAGAVRALAPAGAVRAVAPVGAVRAVVPVGAVRAVPPVGALGRGLRTSSGACRTRPGTPRHTWRVSTTG